MTQHPASQKTTSCGCGGGGAAPCTCHDPCDGCAADTFVRPRFFAGQLLTEEDLQLLADYGVAKDRLHNRYLHGAGVVCGLEVTCDPCGKGKVAIHPGYALDCCGNDLVVPCKVELDVNAMVRRLRLERHGGQDCGDPCAAEAERAAVASGSAAPAPNPERAARRYCLYLEYCEQPDTPVAPYVSEEPCGGRACENTRVREGYRFSLRCPGQEAKPDDLFDRIRACLADLPRVERVVGDAQVHDQVGFKMAAATRVVRGEQPVPFGAEDLRVLREATAELENFGSGDGAKVVDELAARRQLDALFNAARASVAYSLLDEKTRDKLGGEFKDLPQDVERAEAAAREAAKGVDDLLPKLSFARDRTFAVELKEQTLRWLGADSSLPGVTTGASSSVLVANSPQPEAKLYFASGVLRSPRVQTQAASDLAAIREWLLDRLDRGAAKDCHLRQEVLSIPVSPASIADDGTYSASSRRLLRAVIRYLLDCVCSALNPPCAPCDDPAVLLACLEVEECDVVSICNLERTWVLTPAALRYWVPPLSALGEALEKLCCEVPRRIAGSKVERGEPLSETELPAPQVQFFELSSPLYDETTQNEGMARLLRLTGVAESTLSPTLNLAGSLRSVAVGSSLTSLLPLPALSFLGREASLGLASADAAGARSAASPGMAREGVERVVDERLREALTHPEMRASLSEAVQPDVMQKVEAQVAAAARPLTEKAAEGAASMTRLERAMEKRLTAKDLLETKVIKDLRTANTTLKEAVRGLEKANSELAARLKRLEAREVPRA